MSVTEIKDELMKKPMPVYTRGEERFNWISHAIGCLFGFGVLGAFIALIAVKGYEGWKSASLIVYAITIIFLYGNSAIYHGLPKDNPWKRIYRLIDHNTIYFLIAGTYFPICVMAFPGTNLGIIIMSVELFGLVAGSIMNFCNMNNKFIKVFTVVLYVAMGWMLLFAWPAITLLRTDIMLYILFGGLAYTIGVALYAAGKTKKWMHSIFHLLCLIGTALQFVGVLLLL